MRWIALLRGINVGGHNQLLMPELRRLLAAAGCHEIRTYIQSGNAVFSVGATDRGELAGRIAAGIEVARGFRPEVMLLTTGELSRALARNPFREATAAPTTLHLLFLSGAAGDPHPALAALEALRAGLERFELQGGVLYLWCPDGIGRSKLAGGVEKATGRRATVRNWRTVEKLREMAEEAGGRDAVS